MKTIFRAAAVVLCLMTGCSKQEEPAASGESSTSGNPLTAPADYLGAINQAQKTAVRQVDLASLNKAIQLFDVQEGRLPTNLTELVTKRYLPVVPEPPAGSELTYDPETGEVEISR